MAVKPYRLWLAGILVLALALRLFVTATQTYVVYLDEIFQYLEQGHRLAFGSGIKPWEYFDGIRSWLLPGLIAGVMRAASAFGDDPMLYVAAVKTLLALMSLAVVYVGFRYGNQHNGLRGAVVTGLVCAVWFELIYFSPAVLTEVLAAHFALCAVYLGEERNASARRLILSGVLFGLAAYLRVQYAPAMLAAVFWQHRLIWRHYHCLIVGALFVVLPLGVLDALTWGTPFQSIWLNLIRNSVQGVSSSWSVQPWPFYLQFEAQVWQFALPFLVFAILGARQAMALALMATAVLVTHSFVPHKEYRFIYLALVVAPILVGLGISDVVARIEAAAGALAARACLAVLLLLLTTSSGYAATHGILHARFHWLRGDVEVFLAAHRAPGICGLAVKGLPKFAGGGYTYLHRDIPLYLWDYASSYTNPGSDVPLRLAVIFRGAELPQFPGDAFARSTSRFNYLIAPPEGGEPGFSQLSCYANGFNPELPPQICLFGRRGGCE